MRLFYVAIATIALLSGCASTGDWSSDTPTKVNTRASKATRVNLKTQSVSKVYAPSDNLWIRIRDGFQMEPMNSPLEIEQVRWLSARPDYVQRSMARSSRYLFYIVQEVNVRNMPTEIALLPFVESAFVTNAEYGIFGIDTTEKGVTTGDAKAAQHAGWNIRKAGMGPIVTITANSGAVGQNSYIVFSGGSKYAGSGNTAANAQISVNTAGYITSITINNPGLYANTPVATPNTGNAVFTVTMGGRANRVQTETLVAMGSMYGDNDSTYN